jgi:hypothetical protein
MMDAATATDPVGAFFDSPAMSLRARRGIPMVRKES